MKFARIVGFLNYPISDLYVFYFCSLDAEAVEWLRAREIKNPGLSLSAGSANDQLSGLGTVGVCSNLSVSLFVKRAK